MSMNWLDITLLCLAGIGLLKGLFDGVIKQVVSLIALWVGIFFCGKAAEWLRGYLIKMDWFPSEGVTVGSYVLGFLLIVGLVLLAGEVVSKIVGATPLSVLNHIAGGLFGVILTVLFSSLILNVLDVVDRHSALISHETKVESRYYFPVKDILSTIYPGSMFNAKE